MQVLKKYLQKRANYLHNLYNQDLLSLRLYRSSEPSQEQVIVFHAYALFSRYLVGRVGFEPTKQNADDLQSPPFSQTWIPTHIFTYYLVFAYHNFDKTFRYFVPHNSDRTIFYFEEAIEVFVHKFPQ